MTSLVDLCKAVQSLVAGGILNGIPMRGAITTSTIGILDESLPAAAPFAIRSIIGKPIVQAYREEGLFEWAGCTIDEACIAAYNHFFDRLKNQIDDLASLKYLSDSGLIARYPAPHKVNTQERWVVDCPEI